MLIFFLQKTKGLLNILQKLQHTKEEYEKEVSSLKKTVEELTQQLQIKKQDVTKGRGFDSSLSLLKKRKT